MKIEGQHFRTIWLKQGDPTVIQIIDQRWLPHQLVIENLIEVDDFVNAIREMHVRGAPLIGGTAALGLYKAVLTAPDDDDGFEIFVEESIQRLQNTRPTAIDLFNALDRVKRSMLSGTSKSEKVQLALKAATELIDESAAHCKQIGENGLPLIEAISLKKKGQPVNVLTHCNAGWMACIDYGTATAPIYAAYDKGIDVHVWVDETRPRNQGARITAFELLHHGVPHTIIPDNTGGHLMQHGMVDLVIVGTDRTTRTGDVANKIGTYLKALAAKDNDVPFYVTLPSSSFDFTIRDGRTEIPIEQRDPEEVKYIQGFHGDAIKKVLLTPKDSPAVNYGFDVTPAHLVTGLITERGICEASEAGIGTLYPEID